MLTLPPQQKDPLKSDKSTVLSGGVAVLTGPRNADVTLIVEGQRGTKKLKLDDSGKLSLELQGPARTVYVYLADDPDSFIQIDVVELLR